MCVQFFNGWDFNKNFLILSYLILLLLLLLLLLLSFFSFQTKYYWWFPGVVFGILSLAVGVIDPVPTRDPEQAPATKHRGSGEVYSHGGKSDTPLRPGQGPNCIRYGGEWKHRWRFKGIEKTRITGGNIHINILQLLPALNLMKYHRGANNLNTQYRHWILALVDRTSASAWAYRDISELHFKSMSGIQ